MPRFNDNQFNVPQFDQSENVDGASQEARASSQKRPKRSFLVQALLNYFDDADVRVRESQNSLDAQLLAPLADALEDTRLRLVREQSATDIANVPLNIDNFGSYYKVQIADTYEFSADANGTLLPPTIRVFTKEKRWKFITPYDDFVPVPSGAEVAGEPIACPTLFVFRLDGNGYKQESSIGPISFPNQLFLRIENLGDNGNEVRVQFQGRKYPTPISLTGQENTSETVILNEENVVSTRYAWDRIDRVTVWNLPLGATLRVALSPGAFDFQLDPQRPAVHSSYRGLEFQRYWRIRGKYLDESLFLNRFERFETFQSYLCSPAWDAFAIEPNTHGIFGVSGSKLVYADRRENWPANLKRTAIYREPYYNLLVSYDAGNAAADRRVIIRPVRNARSSGCYRHRLTVELPSGELFVISAEGEFTRFSPAVGWRTGVPTSTTIVLSETGSYRFTIDTAGEDGEILQDIAVFNNDQVQVCGRRICPRPFARSPGWCLTATSGCGSGPAARWSRSN